MPAGVHFRESCAAIIPCLDEARTIAQVVTEVRPRVAQVLVVDDGSHDATAARARAAGAEVLAHPRPLGKGQALQDGIQWAVARGFAWALLMDGDGQHAPEDIPRLQAAAAAGADLVVGNRMAQCAAMPWSRRLANQWTSRWLSRRAGVPVPDAQCGFRLARLAAWQASAVRAQGYEVEAAMILAFVAAGFRVEFVPIRTIYGAERSKFRPLVDGWRWLRWWWRGSASGACPASSKAHHAKTPSTATGLD